MRHPLLGAWLLYVSMYRGAQLVAQTIESGYTNILITTGYRSSRITDS